MSTLVSPCRRTYESAPALTSLTSSNSFDVLDPAAAALACISWALLSALLGLEVDGRFLPSGRWLVRFAVTLATSAELCKLRLLISIMSPGYFFYLYLLYVGLLVRCVLES